MVGQGAAGDDGTAEGAVEKVIAGCGHGAGEPEQSQCVTGNREPLAGGGVQEREFAVGLLETGQRVDVGDGREGTVNGGFSAAGRGRFDNVCGDFNGACGDLDSARGDFNKSAEQGAHAFGLRVLPDSLGVRHVSGTDPRYSAVGARRR